MLRLGPTNSLTDVAGLRVGHATRREPGWLTGTTVVVTPPGGCVAGVDVRGGSPGTRETDLLDPLNLVDRVDAIVLGGGSVFGLAAVDGVVSALYADGRGWPVGGPGEVVPIVPAAILFDLGRGGVFSHWPGSVEGAAAYATASVGPVGPVVQGGVGAGTGAIAAVFKGGIGSASVVLESGVTVAALVAVNSAGSPVDPETGELYAVRYGLPGEFLGLGTPRADDVARFRERMAAREQLRAGTATTLGVIATDAVLTEAQCQKLAGIGHDGLARAIDPVHTMVDGDTVFALSTSTGPAPDLPEMFAIMQAAGSCVTRAVAHGLLAAESVRGARDGDPSVLSWRDAFPSAVPPA